VHSPCKATTPTYDFLLGVVTTVAVPLVAFRLALSMGLVAVADRATNVATALAAIAFFAGALCMAWRRSVVRARRERAALVNRVDELEKRVEEAENAAWWGTPTAEADLERTVELGPTVVAFRHRESRQRGAS
jgi:hypothetical protein